MLGILLVDKPRGITSHDVIDRVRKALQMKKVGHAGTLDPMATGLLVVAVGRATRFLQYLSLEPKIYEGEITFGVSTTTQDAEGEIVSQCDASELKVAQIQQAAAEFIGDIEQVPPMFSALKVEGQRLYKFARKGESVERHPRRIQVFEFQIPSPLPRGDEKATSSNKVQHGFRVVCSGGTYVRTLAADMGDKLGVGAHLSALRRVSAGAFNAEDAMSPDDIAESHLIPLERALLPMPMVAIEESDELRARHGKLLSLQADTESDTAGLLSTSGFVGIARRTPEGLWHPECIIPN